MLTTSPLAPTEAGQALRDEVRDVVEELLHRWSISFSESVACGQAAAAGWAARGR